MSTKYNISKKCTKKTTALIKDQCDGKKESSNEALLKSDLKKAFKS
jgi:hypothetical protein